MCLIYFVELLALDYPSSPGIQIANNEHMTECFNIVGMIYLYYIVDFKFPTKIMDESHHVIQ